MKKSFRLLHWAPRILCILAILFISMFALDAFGPGLTIWQQIASFLMGMVPSFLLVMLLVFAWKWEFAGGIVFLLIGLGTSPLIFIHNYTRNQSAWLSFNIMLMVCFPFIVVGILFLVNHFRKKRELTKSV
jgi:hypothetical protein